MKQKWMFILAGSIIIIGMIGWTRTAYHLLTHPPQTVAQGIGASSGETETRKAVPPDGAASTPAQERALEQAREELATRLSIEKSRIETLEIRTVTWPDAALGCPKPDMAYIQVLQEGLLIRLKTGDRVYEYHSGSDRGPFLCDTPPGKK
jgi:hypothetical protein